ncbi:Adenylyl cyclase-associated protein 1 [Gracilariopsis chorda]|uniref:Adenylyl cyclase-associated protein 1 n=1 Tax=Gracilariopsis chorda TaxID=448386 RepID=A0A2V3IR73_9FLOR|nr:Adenylyl cyclase-associated protein 1 [Gracilariopsis chorda]|eukprot:PXF44622.1 Adenylyl cyclase-associated protein 1 [Gracilariopsis chorda]
MVTKKQSDGADHKAFVDALKNLFTTSKAFIKEYYTMGMRYGIGIAGVAGAKIEDANVIDESADGEINYVTAFKELLDGPLASFVEASKILGGEVEEQAYAFQDAWKAELEFLTKAMSMPKPDDFQDMLAPIATEMGRVGTIVEKCGPRGAFANHCSAVGESVGILGWVAVDEKSVSFVGDMADASQFFVNKVRMGAKKTDKPEAHRKWASALEALYKELKAYVKEYHTQHLIWNPPKAVRATPRSTIGNGDEEGGSSKDYVTAFRELLTGPLAAFVEASKKIGGEVEEQSKPFAEAWEAEVDFLSKAISMPKPEDVQSLLGPIAEKMGEVAARTSKVDPRGKLVNHCNSVSESIAALGWVAVEEKPVSFVSDMAGAGQFYLNKVRTGAKNMENPEFHRQWATSLETLYKELKAYVKEYHTQKLIWNPPKTRRVSATASRSSEVVSTSSASDYLVTFKELISGPLSEFVQASEALGGDVYRQAKVFAEAWEAEAEFLEKAIKMQKPSDYQDMLTPIATKIGQVNNIAEEIGPRGTQANHCSAVGEYAAALGWVAVEEKATSYVADMSGSGEFYTHKVKMEAKKTDCPDVHRRWANALEQLFKELKLYVKEHHTQRLTWNKI